MAQRDYFWLDGQRCDAVGIQLRQPLAFSAAKPKIKRVSVPGRNGDLFFAEGGFENVTGEGKCFVLARWDPAEAFAAAAHWCLAKGGYRRLESSEEPGFFRQAIVSAGIPLDVKAHACVLFTLSFDCKPQKFYKSGERPLLLRHSGERLFNPGCEALPLITVYGAGAATLTAGGHTVQMREIGGSLTLDCEMQNAYRGLQNVNDTILAPTFPTLPPGACDITWTGGVTSVEILPRWWTL